MSRIGFPVPLPGSNVVASVETAAWAHDCHPADSKTRCRLAALIAAAER